MALRIIEFNHNNTITLWHDEKGHGGTVTLADVEILPSLLGLSNKALYRLVCPINGCVADTYIPIGGGSDPEASQRLEVLHRVIVQKETITAAKAAVQALVETRDGANRFLLSTERAIEQLRETYTNRRMRIEEESKRVRVKNLETAITPQEETP